MNIRTHPLHHRPRTEGIALVTALIFMVVMLAVLTAYLTMTTTEVRTSGASRKSVEGFYAAEGGLNMRAEKVREIFKGYLRPVGTAPSTTGGAIPCAPGNLGEDDMKCIAYTLNGRTVNTYMVDTTAYTSGNPETGVVGPGDTYAGLNYAQYAYTVRSEALNSEGKREATLEMKFQSRLVPLFQFAAFYQKDLEFHPGPPMTLNGRIHTNANLYMNAGDTLDITGKSTATKDIFRTGKDGRTCVGTVRFSTVAMPCYGTIALPESELTRFNKSVLSNQQLLTVPPMSSLAPDPTGANNSELWSRADIRIVAKKVAVGPLTPSGFKLTVVKKDGTEDTVATAVLQGTPLVPLNPVIQVRKDTFWDARENKWLTMIDVNQQALMDVIQTTGVFSDSNGTPLKLDDATGGGLVIHFSFDDGDARTNGSTFFATNYAVKIRNAARLGSTLDVPPIRGLTIVTNQPIFTQGNYNTVNKKPAALIADAVNILSVNAVADIPQSGVGSQGPDAAPTTVNAAFLSGIDDSVPGDTSRYNGGLQNYTRFHEKWGSGNTFTYRGSFVSLGNSLHVQGRQGATRYDPPKRDWNYDTSFNDANNLPPLTPRFVYLRQLLFARTW